MVFSIRADTRDVWAVIDAIKASLDMEHNYGDGTPTSAIYCEQLKGFLRSMRTSAEEKLLCYDDNSYEASIFKQIIVHIESVIK